MEMNIEQKKEIARAKMKAVLEPSVYESWEAQVDDDYSGWFNYLLPNYILDHSFKFAKTREGGSHWAEISNKLESGEDMNTKQGQEVKLTLEQQAEQLKSKLAEIEKAIEESKVKTKYEIGQTYYVIYENGVYLAQVFHNSVFDNSIITMGNDAATVEEAERKIRRRKAAVVYNAIVERENKGLSFNDSLNYYLTDKKDFIRTPCLLATDLIPAHCFATTKVIAQLTPELINDLFCV